MIIHQQQLTLQDHKDYKMELKIMGSLKAKETILLVWTDNALYTMKFIGAPFTFGLNKLVLTVD